MDSGQWKFAFATLRQYRRWFYTRKSRKLMDDEGLVLRQYEIPKESVIIGKAQVVFLSSAATLIHERECCH